MVNSIALITVVHRRNVFIARQPVEATTVVFRQPDDEVPKARAPEPESIIGRNG